MAKTKSKAMLESKIFDTRIKSANVQNSECWLGYFMGPALVACMNAICGQSYLNTFYTDVLKMSPIAGGLFLALMPMLSKIVDAITNVLMGRIADNTVSRQGKARPWLLISGPLMALSAFLLFAVPTSNLTLQVIWVTVSYNLYFCVAFTMYNISNTLMIPLSTRNSKQRDTLALAYSMGFNMVPGLLVSILFPTIFLPIMGVDQSKWMSVMTIIGLLTIPATVLQFYFTRERISEEKTVSSQTEQVISLKEQVKGCTGNRYWLIIMGIFVIYTLYNNFQVTSTLYYCNWVLGTYNDGSTMAIVNAIGQAPLGLGVVILWPLVKKFSKRSVMMVGCVLAVLGSIPCVLMPTNMGVVLGGLVVRSFGTLPITYTLMAMLADSLDHIEWKNGFRCDGFSASVYSIIFTVGAGISLGLFNLLLGALGYVAPAADGSWVPQSAAVQNLFVAGVFIVPAVGLLIIAALLIFFNVERELPQAQAEIQERHRKEAEARGEVYVSPEEKAAMEQEQLDKEAEEKRIEELKAKCAKKGLDFNTENEKYLAKLAAKQAKAKKK